MIKEMVNVARRLSNAVDAATASLESDSRDDAMFARAPALPQIGEFISKEDMTGCMGLVETRAQLAIRLFAELLKSQPGRTAVANVLSMGSSKGSTMRGASPLQTRSASPVSPPRSMAMTMSFGDSTHSGGGGLSVDVDHILQVAGQVRRSLPAVSASSHGHVSVRRCDRHCVVLVSAPAHTARDISQAGAACDRGVCGVCFRVHRCRSLTAPCT